MTRKPFAKEIGRGSPAEAAVGQLSAAGKRWGGSTLVTDAIGRPSSPWAIERAVRATRGTVKGLPAGFRFLDLRHYFASLLIAAGLDVKVVQASITRRP